MDFSALLFSKIYTQDWVGMEARSWWAARKYKLLVTVAPDMVILANVYLAALRECPTPCSVPPLVFLRSRSR